MMVKDAIEKLQALNMPHANLKVLVPFEDEHDWDDLETIKVVESYYPERESDVLLGG